MESAAAILKVLPDALEKYEVAGDLPHGKVRDFYITSDGNHRVLVATDRLNIFDYQIGLVPYKGQVINELSAWWFERTTDIIPNHFVSSPDPNITIAREARALTFDVVVRGYITGVTSTSLWPAYASGVRQMYGITFAEGLVKNQQLPEPVVTPTTKAEVGRGRREALTDIVGMQYLSETAWGEVKTAALALYKRGQEMLAKQGLILVDSKYEFAYDLKSGKLMLIDELHTPENSRFWLADAYAEDIKAGRDPQSLDKELARLWYVGQNFKETEPAPMPDDLVVAVSQAFQRVYEMTTGQPFQPASYPAQDRLEGALVTLA
jgi:phosphoribosylaminoimidazole-succinocarboxamide synthase